jgi:hypothetical protein
MRLKLIEQLKFKLAGRSVPVVRVSEVDIESGLIRTLQDVGTCKDRSNSIISTWDEKGWEKEKGTYPITKLDAKGNAEMCWIVSQRGQTCNLYTKPWKGPALEQVLGRAATADDIADAMDLGRSMRNMMIGLIIGVMLGWLIIGPMINTVLS